MFGLRKKIAHNSAAGFASARLVLAGITAAALIAGASAARAQDQPTTDFFTHPSYAQPTTGFYIGGGVGPNFLESNRFRRGGGNSTTSYDTGYAGTLAFGYGLGNGLRLELEPGYRNNAVDRVNGRPASSRLQTLTVMGNVIYDFYQFQTPWIPLTPHIGAGVGFAHAWNRSVTPTGNNSSGDTSRFALQAIGGLDYAVTPNQKIGIDYRYMLVHNASFPTVAGSSAHAGDLNNHTVLLTYRYEFNTYIAPPPQPAAAAPPPAPLAPVAQNYQVYFEFDRSTITPEARQVIQAAAQNALKGNTSQILATGHTDTVGTASYNLALSKRRAEAVQAELVRNGVPRNQISTQGVGFNDLAVPTGPNVNEPRNRRVVITLQAPGT